MATTNQQLNALFEKWKEASLNNGEKTNEFGVIFTTDGLVYKNDSFKILFSLKNKKNKVLIIDKSNAIVTCYLYDLLKEEMNKLELDN